MNGPPIAAVKEITESRWYRLRSVLSHVRNRGDGRISAVIRAALSDKPSLIDEAGRLAAAREQMGSFLEEPAMATTGGLSAFPHPSLAIGEVFADRYLVEAFAGAGAMGEVYRVKELRSGDRVALKLIREELRGDSDSRERFRNELKLGRGVVSEHICPLYHFDEGRLSNGSEVAYFTMEFLAGESLDDRLRRGAVAREEAQDIVLQILAGLESAHAKGVLHGDLKCANVFLVPRPDGANRAVITDFGMARQLLATADPRTDGLIMGTPAYMPREQIRGRRLTPAADLYSLAVILFRMATGAFPFAAKSAWETMRLRLETEAPAAETLTPSLSFGWRLALRKGLAAEPEDRLESVTDFREALRAKSPYRRIILTGGLASTIAAAGIVYWKGQEPPPAPEVRRGMALGNEFIDRRGREDYIKALEEFQKVIAIAPRHAPAWIGLAQAYAGQVNWGMAAPKEVLVKAQEAAAMAVSLDPSSARAHSMLGYTISIDVNRWLTAEPHFLKAMQLDGEDANVLLAYAAHMGRTARHKEAIRLLERARMGAPQLLTINHQLAVAYWRARDLDAFLTAARELVRIQPTLGNAHLTYAKALLANGKLGEAAAACAEAERFLVDEPQRLSFEAQIAIAGGNREEGLRLNRRLHDLTAGRPTDAIVLASVPAALGDVRGAVADLEAGFAAGDSAVLAAHDHPLLASVANDPSFLNFVRKTGWGVTGGNPPGSVRPQ